MDQSRYVDADVLTHLANFSRDSGIDALDALIRPDGTIVLTSTVIGEAASDPTFEKDRLLEAWIEARVAAGDAVRVPSPIAAGSPDAGERSIALAIPTDSNPIVVYINDAEGSQFIQNTTGAITRNTQQTLTDGFFGGGISLSDYYAIAYGLANRGIGTPDIPPIVPGQGLYNAELDVSIELTPNGGLLVTDDLGRIHNATIYDRIYIDPHGEVQINPGCFAAGTMIDMWDGTQKPIEEILAGDIVTSYDSDGNLVPGRVSRTFTKLVEVILDVHGLMVTPSHATLCGDGRFAGRHVPIIDILRSDGALVTDDGGKVRAGTGCPLGSLGDRLVWAVTGDRHPDGSIRVRDKGLIRLGTRFISPDGHDVSVMDVIADAGGIVSYEGLIQPCDDGPKMPFLWTFTERLPKPEDYVLQRSRLHLQDIYYADEWEAIGPQMPAPVYGDPDPALSVEREVLRAASSDVAHNRQSEPETRTVKRKWRRALSSKRLKPSAHRKTDVSPR